MTRTFKALGAFALTWALALTLAARLAAAGYCYDEAQNRFL